MIACSLPKTKHGSREQLCRNNRKQGRLATIRRQTLPVIRTIQDSVKEKQIDEHGRRARYLRMSIMASVIALISAMVSLAGTSFSDAGTGALFEVRVWQFVFATVALSLGLWTVVVCESFPRKFNENEGIFLFVIAVILLYMYSIASLFVAGQNSYFIEVVFIVAVFMFSRWMKHKMVSPGSVSIKTSKYIKQTLLMVTLIISVGAFGIWAVFTTQGMPMAIQAAAAVLLVASIESPVSAIRVGMHDAMADATREGIKFSSENAIERSARITTVLFNGMELFVDRIPELCEITPVGSLTAPGLLRLAAGLSSAAGMVYAESIMKAAKEEVDIKIPMPKEFTVVEGYGVEGIVETRSILFGNKRLMIERNIDTEPVREVVEKHAAKGNKIFYLASGNKVAGIIAFEYKPCKNAKKLIEKIKEIGVEVALITSENQRTADALASEIGIDNVYVIAQPAQREEKIIELRSRGKCVAVIGDQIGDVKSTEIADLLVRPYKEKSEIENNLVGLARKGKSDNDLNTVYLDEQKNDIVTVLETGQTTMNTIKRNTLFTIGYNALAISFAAGMFYPIIGFAMKPGVAVVSSMICSLIALRSKQVGKD